MARPHIEIDKNQFENLCKLQCTLAEIAGWFSCSEDTIERWCKREYKQSFADVFSKKREAGKISLRRNLVRLSERNPGAAIFLAKNWLGMTDKQSTQTEVVVDNNLYDAIRDAATAAASLGIDDTEPQDEDEDEEI